jgi:DNA ligase (NAD+)
MERDMETYSEVSNYFMEEADKLADLILLHKDIYYNGLLEKNGVKAISDSEFDTLEDELRRLKPNHEVLSKVGTTGGKIKHLSKMLSIKKTKDENDIKELEKKGELVCSLKMDGNACSLMYRNGELILAKTRGDGEYGFDVTKQIVHINNIPKHINNTDIIEVRGEVVISKDNFILLSDEMIKRGLDKPTSMRNIVAGVLNTKKVHDIDLAKFLTFIAYGSSQDTLNYLETLNELALNQFKTVEVLTYKDNIQLYKDSAEKLDYLTDGLVFRINDNLIYNKQTVTSHHSNGSLAFKLNAEEKVTTIINIEAEVQRTGKISYVAVVKPVTLSGAKVQRVTLHNAKNILDNNLGIGAKIKINRSNEVIPKFLKTIEGANTDKNLSMVCPSCGEQLSWSETKTDLLCTNNNCEGIFFYKVLHFIKTLDIDWFSDKTLRKLFELGYIDDIGDIFNLTYKAFLNLKSFKKKSAENLYNAIQSKKNIPLDIFLTSLGIHGLGKTASNLIVKKYKTLDNILNQSIDDFTKIDGIGETIARSIFNNFDLITEFKNDLIEEGCVIVDINNSVNKIANKIDNMNIVITGSLSIQRKQWKRDIELSGSNLKSSVSKATDILVCNDKESNSSKLKKARELNIKIITEDELIELIK